MAEFTKKAFGERLQALRKRLGYNYRGGVTKFCEDFHQIPYVWGLTEKGERKQIYLSTIVDYCKLWDLSPMWLIYGIGPQSFEKAEQLLIRQTPDKLHPEEVAELVYDTRGQKKDSKAVKGNAAQRTKRTKKGDTDIISKGKDTATDTAKKRQDK